MSVRGGESVTVPFTTRSTAGAGSDADSAPTGTLYLNGVANAAAVTVTHISTGLYKAAVTLPALSIGDQLSIVIAATVGGTSDSASVWADTCDIALDNNGDVTFNNAGVATASNQSAIAAEIAALPSAAQNAAAVWTDTNAGDFTTAGSPGYVLMAANAIETGLSFVQALRGCVAGIFGKITNAGSNPETFQNPAGTANRLTVNNDSSGNRTTVTTNL